VRNVVIAVPKQVKTTLHFIST